jgi:phosphatidylcholine synthase
MTGSDAPGAGPGGAPGAAPAAGQGAGPGAAPPCAAPGAKPGTTPGRIGAYLVHLYTAAGVLLAFLAAAEIASASPDVVRVFLLLGGALIIDATDGPLARRLDVRRGAPTIDGRTIDDIVDYLTYTFLPLLLIWRMGWVPAPAIVWIAPALVTSLFGFASTAAKDEAGGFFRGFPSYWNVVAFYAGIVHNSFGPWPNAVVVLALAALTVAPVRFLYINLAPRPWRWPLLAGAAAWLGILLVMLAGYPRPAGWLVALSAVYPAVYVLLSVVLARRAAMHGG